MLAAATRLAKAVARGRNAEMTRPADDQNALRASLDLPSTGNIINMEGETKDTGKPRFSPKTITNYYLVVAAVFATAKDRKGKQLFPRQWDLNYIGLPAVIKKEQNTPTFESAEIETDRKSV